ncbi:hypothetical protein GCM10009665_10310 [Kitasatospora nipponensis]|uniref:BON domain-containing protein n=2 Tax=Kitasatospora nipponensis TaxID=258049 RepID=A0ABP4GDW0_9ACTN
MDKRKVKRLPVVDEVGRLVDIVSRRDLLQVFLRHDAAIREEINHDVLGRTLWLAPGDVGVAVQDGVVTLTGRVPRKSLIPITEQLCRAVDGVVAVHQTLTRPEDDAQLQVEHPPPCIQQHRLNNDDLAGDWIFEDPRLDLVQGPDEVLLAFLARVVHPEVAADVEEALARAEELNRLLAPDGWGLRSYEFVSGRPLYTAGRANGKNLYTARPFGCLTPVRRGRCGGRRRRVGRGRGRRP